MDYFAGLDVSVKDTSVCIVDSTGKIVREVSSVLDWKLDRCRNGCSVRSPKQACR